MAAKIKAKNKFVFAIALTLFLAVAMGKSAQAFLFSRASEKTEIYPQEVRGDWRGEKNVLGKAQVKKDGNARDFDDKNSAIYSGGTKELILENFGKTEDELEEKTEDEEIIENLSGGELSQKEKTEENILGKLWRNFFSPKIAEAKNRIFFSDLKKSKLLFARVKASLAVLPLEEKSGDNADSQEEPGEVLGESSVETTDSVVSDLGVPETDISGSEEKTSSPKYDWDIDSKVIVWYSLGDSEEWEALEIITQDSISNRENGGYFSWEMPFVEKWEDISKLKLKFEGVVDGEVKSAVYLDSVWVEADYEEGDNQSDARQAASGKKNWKLKSEKNGWSMKDAPVFHLEKDEPEERGFWETVSGVFSRPKIKVKLRDPDGEERELKEKEDFVFSDNSFEKVELLKNNSFRPGKYTIELETQSDGVIYSFEQDFTWGVLAINANKSIYAPGENGKLSMAVLDERGSMVCDAELRLRIKNEALGVDEELSTENEKIKVNLETCQSKAFTLEPDYAAEYEFVEEGIYELTLTAETGNGTYEIADRIEVKKEVPFDVERVTATRIYPVENYPVRFNIKANEDFKGKIVETVPGSFEIINSDNQNNKFEIETDKETGIKKIIWEVDIKKGTSLELEYKYDAPDVSPEFYLLGPLKFIEKSKIPFFDDKMVFKEARQWQIASDDTLIFQETCNSNPAQVLNSSTTVTGGTWGTEGYLYGDDASGANVTSGTAYCNSTVTTANDGLRHIMSNSISENQYYVQMLLNDNGNPGTTNNVGVLLNYVDDNNYYACSYTDDPASGAFDVYILRAKTSANATLTSVTNQTGMTSNDVVECRIDYSASSPTITVKNGVCLPVCVFELI